MMVQSPSNRPGAFKSACAPDAYREKLFGQGALPPAAHPAARHRG